MKISEQIKKLRDNLNNPNIPEDLRKSIPAKIAILETDLAKETAKAAKPAVDKIAKKAATAIKAGRISQKFKEGDAVIYDDEKVVVVSFLGLNMEKTANKYSVKPYGDKGVIVNYIVEESELIKDASSPKKPAASQSPAKNKAGMTAAECEELIAKEREKLKKRKVADKKRASTSEKTKNVTRVEKVTEIVEDSIEHRIEQGKPVSAVEIRALIAKYEESIKELKKLLKQVEK